MFSWLSRPSSSTAHASAIGEATRPQPYAARDPKPVNEPDVFLDLPLHSIVILSAPRNALTGLHEPLPAQVPGIVEIRMPEGMTRRCRGIRIIRRTWCILALSPTRQGEVDILHDDVQDVEGPCVLRPGLQRFAFDHVVKPDIPGIYSGWPRGRSHMVAQNLMAQVLGDEVEATPPHPVWDLTNVTRSPAPPSYKADPSDEIGVRPLERTFSTWRAFKTLYNPSPTGGVSLYNDRFATFVPELGLVRGHTYAKEFSLAGPMITSCSISGTSSATTIYAVRLAIHEHKTVTSPRDGAQRVETKVVPFCSLGEVPALEYKDGPVKAGATHLWKGVDAGGSDEGPWQGVQRSRWPQSDDLLWTTIPEGPATVRAVHEFWYDVYFSVRGFDADGRRRPGGAGAGGLRVVRRKTKIVLPTCSLIPEALELPPYAGWHAPPHQIDSAPSHLPDEPCASCGHTPLELQCNRCPQYLPHVKHDAENACATCQGKTLLPRAYPTEKIWACACVAYEATNGAGDPTLMLPEDDEPLTSHGPQSIEADQMLAVKLESEWNGKMVPVVP